MRKTVNRDGLTPEKMDKNRLFYPISMKYKPLRKIVFF